MHIRMNRSPFWNASIMLTESSRPDVLARTRCVCVWLGSGRSCWVGMQSRQAVIGKESRSGLLSLLWGASARARGARSGTALVQFSRNWAIMYR
jgi:hypothetical protein